MHSPKRQKSTRVPKTNSLTFAIGGFLVSGSRSKCERTTKNGPAARESVGECRSIPVIARMRSKPKRHTREKAGDSELTASILSVPEYSASLAKGGTGRRPSGVVAGIFWNEGVIRANVALVQWQCPRLNCKSKLCLFFVGEILA